MNERCTDPRIVPASVLPAPSTSEEVQMGRSSRHFKLPFCSLQAACCRMHTRPSLHTELQHSMQGVPKMVTFHLLPSPGLQTVVSLVVLKKKPSVHAVSWFNTVWLKTCCLLTISQGLNPASEPRPGAPVSLCFSGALTVDWGLGLHMLPSSPQTCQQACAPYFLAMSPFPILLLSPIKPSSKSLHPAFHGLKNKSCHS